MPVPSCCRYTAFTVFYTCQRRDAFTLHTARDYNIARYHHTPFGDTTTTHFTAFPYPYPPAPTRFYTPRYLPPSRLRITHYTGPTGPFLTLHRPPPTIYPPDRRVTFGVPLCGGGRGGGGEHAAVSFLCMPCSLLTIHILSYLFILFCSVCSVCLSSLCQPACIMCLLCVTPTHTTPCPFPFHTPPPPPHEPDMPLV